MTRTATGRCPQRRQRLCVHFVPRPSREIGSKTCWPTCRPGWAGFEKRCESTTDMIRRLILRLLSGIAKETPDSVVASPTALDLDPIDPQKLEHEDVRLAGWCNPDTRELAPGFSALD